MAVITRRILIAAAAALALAGCDRPGMPGGSAGGFKAIDITGADYARELSLPDASGRLRTLAELAEVKRQLGADGARVQGIFVTVDPERDTAEVLKPYVANFDPSFVALRGSPDETKAAAKQFKIFYNKVPGKTETSYTVDHTAGSYVFDTQGRVRLFTRYGSGAPALVHDIQLLLAEQK